MVNYILALQQLRFNRKNNDEKTSFIKNNSTIQLVEKSNSQPQNKICVEISVDRSEAYINNKYLSFAYVQKILYQLLTYDRIVLQPHIVSKFTEIELSKKLNITTGQLEELQNSLSFCKKIAEDISLTLINLYCTTVLQQPELIHDGGMRHE